MKKLEMKIVSEPGDNRPPKDWWDTCTSKAASFASDPDKFCGWLWANGPENLKQGFAEAAKEVLESMYKQFKEQDEPGQRDLTPKVVMPDEHGQCPEGMILNTELGQCVKSEGCPEGQHFDQKVQQCVPDAEEESETPQTAVGTTPAPKEEIVEPSQLEEKVNRIKAELKAKSYEEQAVIWEKQFIDLDKKHHQTLGKTAEQEKTIIELRKESRDLNEKRLKLDGDLREEQRETDNLHRQIRDMQKNMEELTTNHTELSKKYTNAVGINLELSKKLTKANEDYLGLASKNELLEAALKRSQIQAKKIIRIKP